MPPSSGHHRYAICQRLGISYRVTPYAEKQRVPNPRGVNQHSEVDRHSDDQPTHQRLAQQHKVSPSTIERDGAYATAVDTLEAARPGLRQALLRKPSGQKTARLTPQRGTTMPQNNCVKMTQLFWDPPTSAWPHSTRSRPQRSCAMAGTADQVVKMTT